MPSKLPKVNFVLEEADLALVRQYQAENAIKSLSKAFVDLVAKGLENENKRIAAQEEAAKKQQPVEGGGLSDVEKEFFNQFRALPASHKGLAASLCLALIQELVKHQTVGTASVASSPVGSDRR